MEASVFYPVLFSPKDAFGNVAAMLGDELSFEARKVCNTPPLYLVLADQYRIVLTHQ